MEFRICKKVLSGMVLTAGLVSTAFAGVSARSDAVQAWEKFQASYGEGWYTTWNHGTGYAEFVYGMNIEPSVVPTADRDFIDMARNILRENEALFGVNPDQLVVKSVNFSPLAHVGSADKISVEFVQFLDGVEVHGGNATVLFLTDGRITAINVSAYPIESGRSVFPHAGAIQAIDVASATLTAEHGVPTDVVTEPRLVIYPEKGNNGAVTPRLAWIVTARHNTAPEIGLPIKWTYVISADSDNATVIDKWNEVHTADITGTLDGWASPGLTPDKTAYPEVQIALEDITLTISGVGTTTNTNESGAFTFANQTMTRTITGTLFGPLVNVNDQAGSDDSVSGSFTPGVPGTLTFNPSKTELSTGEVNAAKWVNEFRDYIVSVVPSYTLMNFRVLANVNINSSCNAFYDGSSINMYRAAGGCVNTSYSTVIAHEEGHWANSQSGTGNGSDGVGEGMGDTWALYMCNTMNGNTDDPIVGREFCGSNCHIRTGENTRQFCGDCCGGCHGGVHNDGEVIMGAFWKMRKRLKQTNGAAMGSSIANSLLVTHEQTYNRTTIKNIWVTDLLTLDDNDGNINNGTPHYSDINLGWKDQGFPGFDLPIPPVVNSLTPSSVQALGGTTITAAGSGFNTVTSVTVGGVSASFTKVSDVQLTFVAPQAPGNTLGNKQVIVTNPSGTDGTKNLNYTATDPPQLSTSTIAFRGLPSNFTTAAGPGEFYAVYTSLVSGNTCFGSLGCFGIGGGNPLNLIKLFQGTLNGAGIGSVTFTVPNDPALANTTWYDQVVAINFGAGTIKFSNVVTVLIF